MEIQSWQTSAVAASAAIPRFTLDAFAAVVGQQTFPQPAWSILAAQVDAGTSGTC
jgi:hypothetical protein